MTHQSVALCSFVLAAFAGVAACSTSADPPAQPSSESDERGPIGKADLTGSCKLMVDDVNGNQVEKNYCGDQSYGNCWCDEQCSDYGDCCEDYAASCNAPPDPSECGPGQVACAACCTDTPTCAPSYEECPLVMCPAWCPPDPGCEGGQLVFEGVYVDSSDGMECAAPLSHCVTNDAGACPEYLPLPEDFCQDGTIVQGPPSYIPSTDGKECENQSTHCLTGDYSACPSLSPLPLDYCPDGTAAAGPDAFMPSADGKECKMANVHCLTNDASACPQN